MAMPIFTPGEDPGSSFPELLRRIGAFAPNALATGGGGANAPIRRNSSGKLDPGSSPGVKRGIAMEAYCPPFWT